MVKVSVIMPSYNCGEYIGKAIDSVLAQNFKDWELIIVDDASTDTTKDILKKHEGNEKIKIITCEENKGLTASCNDAIGASSGEYILRLDADDYLDENAILVLSNVLDKNVEIGLVYPDYILVDEQGKIIEYVRCRKIYEEDKLLDLPPLSTGMMMKRACLDELGGYNEMIRCQDTYDLWIRFTKKFQVYNVNLPLFYYRKRGFSLTRNREKILTTRRFLKRSFVEREFKEPKPRVLGLIPMRAKSESFRDKAAVRKLGGKPLLAWVVQEAIKTKILDRVVVTTEDKEIAEVAKTYGAEVIMRPESLARIATPIESTVLFVIDRLKQEGYSPDIVAIIHANSPLVKGENITEAIDTLLIYDADSVISVCEDLKFHYQPSVYGLKPLFEKRLLRLEKEALYEENGVIYVSRTDVITGKSFLGKKIGHVVMMPEESVHIDSEYDFWLAEQIVKKKLGD